MAGKAIERDVALRIGLAARELEGVETPQLLQILVAALGMPLSMEKLNGVTQEQLKEEDPALFESFSPEATKKAMEALWGHSGVEISDKPLPQVDAYAVGDMPGSIRIALASNNGTDMDGHFGSCLRFLVYQVSPDEARLIDIRSIDANAERELEKNVYRSELIADCQLLYVVSIGGPAAAKVVKQEVHPIKQPSGGSGEEVIDELQRILKGTPPPWLAKVMGQQAEERVRFQREEDEVSA